MKQFLWVCIATILLNGCVDFNGSNGDKVSLECSLQAADIVFEDENVQTGVLSGSLSLGLNNGQCNATHFSAQWLDSSGNDIDTPLVFTAQSDVSENSQTKKILLNNITKKSNYARLRLTPFLNDRAGTAVELSLRDLGEYTQVFGPGGNRFNHWYYGEDRPALLARTEMRGERKICLFENDKVLIHDSAYDTDPTIGKNTPNDLLYPPFEFDCTESQINNHRLVMTWEDKSDVIHTYSMLNDAFYYADLTFSVFEKYLAERPLEKLRVRVHYGMGDSFNYWAHWDGAYVNLNDVEFRAYGSASLDTVSHETAHGVLQAQSALKHPHEVDYSLEGRTLHEAYADLASIMAKYSMTGELLWVIGEENFSINKRYLDRIETESGAVLSYLDSATAGSNYYRRMGIMTYPFYLLTQAWGIERTFTLYTNAAMQCWLPGETLIHAAGCIKQQAKQLGYSEQDVIDAFRTVKVKLQEQDTFAHFKSEKRKRTVDFENLTQTDRTLVSQLWDFGDGQTSSLESPQHVYAQDGTYKVTLTVNDHAGVTDSFSRTLDVTDQYCAPRQNGARHRFENVTIAGQVIQFDADEWDYTDQVIAVNAGEDIAISITGDKLNDTRESVTWYLNVDLNDDGIYTGVDYSDLPKSEQLLREEVTGDDLVLNHTFKVLEQYKGKTYFLRVSSDSTGFPCSTRVGNTLDVRIQVN